MVAVQSIILYFKIIFRQESNQAMPWLADLVESNEGSFNVLPVQCLCEFLLDSTNNLMESDEEGSKDQKTKKRKQVRNDEISKLSRTSGWQRWVLFTKRCLG